MAVQVKPQPGPPPPTYLPAPANIHYHKKASAPGPTGKVKSVLSIASFAHASPSIISNTFSTRSVAISELPETIDYDDPIFGELKENQKHINPCCNCHGRCVLSTWCRTIGIIEIVSS